MLDFVILEFLSLRASFVSAARLRDVHSSPYARLVRTAPAAVVGLISEV